MKPGGMRILIDALAVLPGVNGGAATYVSGLVDALSEFGAEHEFLVLGTTANRHLFPRDRKNLSFRPVRVSGSRALRLAYEQCMVPLVAREWRASAGIFPGNMSPLALRWMRIPSLVTIHDAAPAFYQRRFPGYFPEWKRVMQRFLARHAAHDASFVFTNSEFGRHEVGSYTGASSERILAVTPGCPRAQSRAVAPAALARHYGFEAPYVFMLGGSSKHKNYDSAARAFAGMKRQTGLPHHLVLAGPRGNGLKDILRAVRDTGAEHYVHLLGYVPSAHLLGLYQGAELFFMPSLYEGFGFPVLEAMDSGVPVLAARSGSLPEVGGDAVLYCDGNSVDAMADAIGSVLSDAALRAELASRGRLRARRFTWESTARQVLECCALACARVPGTAVEDAGRELAHN